MQYNYHQLETARYHIKSHLIKKRKRRKGIDNIIPNSQERVEDKDCCKGQTREGKKGQGRHMESVICFFLPRTILK
jgi:hypothetical protein